MSEFHIPAPRRPSQLKKALILCRKPGCAFDPSGGAAPLTPDTFGDLAAGCQGPRVENSVPDSRESSQSVPSGRTIVEIVK